MDDIDVSSGDKAIIILQSLICYLREKNIFSRADMSELRERVEARMSETDKYLPGEVATATAAAREIATLDEYCGKRYGGKRRRVS